MNRHTIPGLQVSTVIHLNQKYIAKFIYYSVLDPRIMYEGLKEDFTNEPELLAHLEASKKKLQQFYQKQYSRRPQSPNTSTSNNLPSTRTTTSTTVSGSPQKVNFTSRYQKRDRIAVNELEEYFKLPREDFETCEPLQWWRGRRSQFPNLYRLICDIFSIPGECQHSSH